MSSGLRFSTQLPSDFANMAEMPKRHQDPAHDVLAAEEFAMPTRDPALEPAHDVLAADEFAVPTADPDLHHGPVELPDDPSGIDAPHDVLAAEEFAMPASRPSDGEAVALARRHSGSLWRVVAAATVATVLVRLLRRG